jgi:predicted metal-dependent peptidase
MTEPNLDLQAIETKLAAARTRLILDKPFLGALVLRLPMIAAKQDWCKTTATDARSFYYNPAFINSLDMSQTQFILAHEALHCALSHFFRREHRIKHRWDIACDFAINPLLVDDGLSPPPEALLFDAYRGMTAEEIYPLLDDNDQSETLDQHLYDDKTEQQSQNDPKSPPQSKGNQQADKGQNKDGDKPDKDSKPRDQDEPDESQGREKDPRSKGSGTSHDSRQQEKQAGRGSASESENTQSGKQGEEGRSNTKQGADKPPPLSSQEKENLAVQWQQRLAGAAQQAMQSGKFGGDMARIVDHMLQPRLPWRMLLADFMTASARDDFSYMRPSRREGSAILPSLRSSQIDLAIAIDTSGSIRDEEIDEFLSEIDAIKSQLRARISLLPCDSELARDAPWIFESWDEITMPDLKGGGGTSFVPVFDWADKQDKLPDLLVYFTDAVGQFPKVEPGYPVIWLVKGKQKTPWGRRIQLN